MTLPASLTQQETDPPTVGTVISLDRGYRVCSWAAGAIRRGVVIPTIERRHNARGSQFAADSPPGSGFEPSVPGKIGTRSGT
jgi:hypothetical protein